MQNFFLGAGVDKELPKYMSDAIEFADEMSADKPRVIKSHLPFELLPRNLLQTCKG